MSLILAASVSKMYSRHCMQINYTVNATSFKVAVVTVQCWSTSLRQNQTKSDKIRDLDCDAVFYGVWGQCYIHFQFLCAYDVSNGLRVISIFPKPTSARILQFGRKTSWNKFKLFNIIKSTGVFCCKQELNHLQHIVTVLIAKQ